MKNLTNRQKFIFAIIGLAIVLFLVQKLFFNRGLPEGFERGNGSIEVNSIDIATKLPGRVSEILVDEGDRVTKGQTLAVMKLESLEAQLHEATAMHEQAINAVASAKAQITARESDKKAAEAVVVQRQSELYAANKKLERIQTLVKKGAISKQDLDDQKAYTESLKAAILTAEAQVLAAQSAIEASKAQAMSAESQVKAAKATMERVQADIDDSTLTAPTDGRIQYRVANQGEVLGSGGVVLNMIDLKDVYMTFFVPERTHSLVVEGDEARIIIDAAPEYVIPAKITFVAPRAQFTPKEIETSDEREKMMFRVKARVDAALLQKYQDYIKVGVRGEAWVRTDKSREWPAELKVKLPAAEITENNKE